MLPKNEVGSTKQQLNSSNQICKSRSATYLTSNTTRNLVTVYFWTKFGNSDYGALSAISAKPAL